MNDPKHKPLVIRDEIHGDMTFDGLLRQIIDHECFQRLRYIKQLGLAEYVFPCANHTRFQHSLGASYLAGRYYHHMLKSWALSPVNFEVSIEGTKVFADRTAHLTQLVSDHPSSREYWWQVVSLAGLLHDIGHGPWSHSFEQLNLSYDFRDVTAKLDGSVKAYFADCEKRNERFWHEDVSVLYIAHIFKELEKSGGIARARRYFLPVTLLVHKGLAASSFRAELERELASVLEAEGVKGGIEFHQLLRPIISGPFDVDRIDYIQRDGRNCGVSIGGIEWRRIVSKVIPCLTSQDVCLLSNVKNQHVIDDFIFSLFQMYAQVYLHPKVVGLEEVIKETLEAKGRPRESFVVTFDLHRSLSDEKFRDLLKREFQAPEIDDILLRKGNAAFSVASYPDDAAISRTLKQNGFRLVDMQDRPMMKDPLPVYFFSALKRISGAGNYVLRPWSSVSPIARQLETISYSPNIWLHRGA